MKQHQISCEIQARYFIDEPVEVPVKSTWMLLHGYGQLVHDFQPSFESCLNMGFRCVYPEGLSTFYSSIKNGKVGASWMTKEDRHTAIANALNYLQAVVDQSYSPDLLLGFSQGAEMASRLCLSLETKALVLWGGRLAPDVLEGESLEKIKAKKIFIVQGIKDQIYSQEKHEHDVSAYRDLGIELEVLSFDGGHIIDEKVLHELSKVVDYFFL